MPPYANSMGATPAALTSIASYLSNTNHAHHQDYELTPIQVLGVRTVREFLDYAKASFTANKRKSKAGRPPKNGGNWIIVRTPEGTNLAPHEMAAYERAAVQAAGLGGQVVGILNWHRNLYTGADDLNLLSAAFSAEGNSVRDRSSHTIKHLRWIMDQVTDDLNIRRREMRAPPILTMQEIKRERAQQRGERDVIEELARLPRPPTKTQDLEPALISLGYKVTRFAPEKDVISIIPPMRKKAKRFRISLLIDEVIAFLMRLRTLREPSAHKESVTSSEPSEPEHPPSLPSEVLAQNHKIRRSPKKKSIPDTPVQPGQ